MMVSRLKVFARQVIRIAKPFWKSGAKKQALGVLLLAIVFTFGLVVSQYLLTQWNQAFYDSLQNTDKIAFDKCIKTFFLISALLLVTTGLQFYFNESLGVRWRESLTQYCVGLWMNRGSHYFSNFIVKPIDNPDQRISQDVDLFVKGILNFGIELFKQLLTFGVFIAMLWTMSSHFKIFGATIPGYLVWVSIGYACLGTLVSHFMGKKILPLNLSQQVYEADFRYNLVRTRENSENILLMQGDRVEQKRLLSIFGGVIKCYSKLIHKRSGLMMFTSGYTTFAAALPILIAAPTFFAKEISLGEIVQTAAAFTMVNGAMSYFVNLYASISEWSASV